MSTLDTDRVWKKLNDDEKFTNGTPEQAMEPFRKLVEALPKILDGQLESKVTLATLGKAKLAILEHQLGSDFVEKLVPLALSAFPEEVRPDPEDMIAQLKEGFEEQRTELMKVIGDLPAFLEENGMTERMALSSEKGGLNAKCLKAYDKGTLTIAGLLETQPAVLLAN